MRTSDRSGELAVPSYELYTTSCTPCRPAQAACDSGEQAARVAACSPDILQAGLTA